MDLLNLNLSKNKWIYVSISLLITILLFSCDHSNQKSDKPNSKRNISKTSEYFTKTIGNFKDGEINLSMSKQDLLALYQEYNTKYNLQRKGMEFEIITDSEDRHLLVFYNTDESATTFRIYQKTEDSTSKSLISFGTSCTTKACSQERGKCVPTEFGTCTECDGDCTRTISDEEEEYSNLVKPL